MKLILAFRNFAIAPKKETYTIKRSNVSDCFDKRKTSAPHIFYKPGAPSNKRRHFCVTCTCRPAAHNLLA